MQIETMDMSLHHTTAYMSDTYLCIANTQITIFFNVIMLTSMWPISYI